MLYQLVQFLVPLLASAALTPSKLNAEAIAEQEISSFSNTWDLISSGESLLLSPAAGSNSFSQKKPLGQAGGMTFDPSTRLILKQSDIYRSVTNYIPNNRTVRRRTIKLIRSLDAAPEKYRELAQECKERFEAGELNFTHGPSQDNLDCLYWHVKRLVVEKRRKRIRSSVSAHRWRTPIISEDLIHKAYETLSSGNVCENRKFVFSLKRSLEKHLPQQEAVELIRHSYQSLTPCFDRSHPVFADLHTRMGLLFLAWGNSSHALESFRLAINARFTSQTKRALFWAGYIKYRSDAALEEASAYWNQLIALEPTYLHSMLALKMMGQNPSKKIVEDDPVQASAFSGDEWNLENYSAFILSLLHARGLTDKFDTYVKEIGRWIRPKDQEQAIFFAHLYESIGDYRRSIILAHRALRHSTDSSVNEGLLDLLYPRKFESLIREHADELDPALVFALIHQESAFDPDAKSSAGASGLMQVMPRTGKYVMKKQVNLFDPSKNVIAGSKFLRMLYQMEKGNEINVLASYNAGPGRRKEWQKRYTQPLPDLLFADLIPFPETRNYVSKLLVKSFWYSYLLESPSQEDEERKFTDSRLQKVANDLQNWRF